MPRTPARNPSSPPSPAPSRRGPRPRRSTNAQSTTTSRRRSNPTCGICLEAIASGSTVFTHTPAQTPDVHHVFHKACMDAWCANRLMSEACLCPTCRQAVGNGGRFKAGCKCCGLPFSSDNPRFVWTTLDHTSPTFNNAPYHRSCISPLIVLDSKSLAVTYVGSQTFQRDLQGRIIARQRSPNALEYNDEMVFVKQSLRKLKLRVAIEIGIVHLFPSTIHAGYDCSLRLRTRQSQMHLLEHSEDLESAIGECRRLLGSLLHPDEEEDEVNDAILQMRALDLVSQHHPDWVEYMLQDTDGTAFVSLLLMSLSDCS